jgi:hypothetical protein
MMFKLLYEKPITCVGLSLGILNWENNNTWFVCIIVDHIYGARVKVYLEGMLDAFFYAKESTKKVGLQIC